MTTAIIGDIHGALTPLRALVAKLDLQSGDHLVLVGDLVDKGPEPAGVVRFLRALSETAPFRVILIEGNHEDRHRRYHINTRERPGVARKMAEGAAFLPALAAELTEADYAFLAGAVPFVRIPGWNMLVVHGGIPGDMTEFPDSLEAAEALTGKARGRFRKILRTRYVERESGKFLALGDNAPSDPFWAETYDGRFGHVVFGHQPWRDGPACFPHATGVDTGAVHGGGLTALVLPGKGEAHFVSIASESHLPFRETDIPDHPGSRLSLIRPMRI
ncbi:MAG: serine/threonine protein phosphatase [Hyphomonadaceae bacterium]|nr:serine/threonine protein phosphatase [Hyphomonadaceae bacterium]